MKGITVQRLRAVTVPSLVLAVALGASGCRKTEIGGPGSGAKTPGDAVATVDGELIREQELRDLLTQVQSSGGSHKVLEPKVAIGWLIEARLVEREADKAGYRKDPEVQRKLKDFSRQALGEFYIKTLRQDFVNSQEVTEQEIQKLGGLGTPRYDVHVILVDDLEDATAIYVRLKRGENFETVAKEMSTGLSAPMGGALGPREVAYFRDMYGFDIERLGLAPGQLSNPIRTEVGHLIMRLNGVANQNAEGKFEELVLAAQQNKAGRRFEDETFRKMIETIPVRYNEAHLKSGQLVRDAIPGRPEAMPDNVFARLGDVQIDRAMLTELGGPTLFSTQYQPYIMTVIEKIVYDEYFFAEAMKKRPELQKDPAFLARLARQESDLIRKKYIHDKVETGIAVAPQEIDEHYRTNLANYKHGKMWDISHILVRSAETAEKVLGFLNEGADFGLVAQKFSEDNLRTKGGYVGRIAPEQLVPALARVVQSLPEGGFSGSIKDDAGYHILKAGRIYPPEDRGLEEVREEIQRKLWAQKLNVKLKELTGRLLSGAAITYNEELIAKLGKDFSSPHGTEGMGGAAGMGGGVPAGHPPMGGGAAGQMPAGHPPMGK